MIERMGERERERGQKNSKSLNKKLQKIKENNFSLYLYIIFILNRIIISELANSTTACSEVLSTIVSNVFS